jgi:hypothetical protein
MHSPESFVQHRRNATPALIRAAVATVLALSAAPATFAQCQAQWLPSGGVTGGAAPTVFAMTQWDPDGPGPLRPVLVVAGEFTMAGTTPANNIATWDGTNWSALGPGIAGGINALAVLPSGDLVAAGSFSTAGTVAAGNIARWNGSAWSALGSSGGADNTIEALAVLPTGDLVATGYFGSIGGVAANRIARWNGSTWFPLGTGLNNGAYALAVMPNGDLIVGGTFTQAGSAIRNRIALWNGSAWSSIGSMNAAVFSLAATSAGDLYAGGQFTTANAIGVNYIARRSNGLWGPLGTTGVNMPVMALSMISDGVLLAGGHFTVTAGPVAASKIGSWNGSAWTGYGAGCDAVVLSVAQFNGEIIAGGYFTSAGGQPSPNFAHWGASGTPTISTQPAPLTACRSGAASFSVAAAPAPLTYQWRHGGAPIDPIANATAATATLTLSNVGTADAGSYDCVVSSSCDTITSASASLTICAVDFNCSGSLSVQDIFDFLNAWFSGAPEADFDGLNGLQVQDIFDFLNAWFAGC